MSFFYDNTLTSITVPAVYSTTGAYAVSGYTNLNIGAIRTSVEASSASESNFNYLACFAKNATSSSTNNFTGRFRVSGLGTTYSVASFVSAYADYAEFFESFDGEEIPVGTSVVIVDPDSYELVIQDPDGSPFSYSQINEVLCGMSGAFNCLMSINKKCYIRPATGTDSPDDIIGVIRPKNCDSHSSFIGNNAWAEWTDKYITDEFGKREMTPDLYVTWENMGVKYNYPVNMIPKDIRVPPNAVKTFSDSRGNVYSKAKENPLYVSSSTYIPREQRKEWNVVGLLGQVPVLSSQPKGRGWKKLSKLSDSVDLYFIK